MYNACFMYVFAAVDSDEETVYFFDMDENVINSIGADGTNMKQFITTGKTLHCCYFFRNLILVGDIIVL